MNDNIGNDGLKWPETHDAVIWAKEFIKTIEKHPDIPKDEGTMTTWFANAIMKGWDTAEQRIKAKEKISYHCRYSLKNDGEHISWITDDYCDLKLVRDLMSLRDDMVNPKIIKKFTREEEMDTFISGERVEFPIKQVITTLVANEKPMGFIGRTVNRILRFLHRNWVYFYPDTHK